MIIDYIALRADDIHKVSKWYQETVGAVVTHEDKYYIRLTTDNTTIAIIDKNKYQKILVFLLITEMIF